MKLYLIAGTNSDSLKQALEKNNIDVIRCEASLSKALDFLSRNYLEYDTLLLTDQGVIEDYVNFKDLLEKSKQLINRRSNFKFITKDIQLERIFNQVFENDLRFSVYFTDQIKIPVSMLVEFCISSNTDSEKEDTASLPVDDTVILKKSKSLFDKFKSGLKKDEDSQNCKLISSKKDVEKTISAIRDLKRIVAITGHRGVGVTGTVANIASVASDNGLSVMVIDLDTVYRGINLFFSKFGDETEVNSELSYSLIRCLMNPESYDVNSCKINKNLSIITLGYSVSSKERIAEALQYKRIVSLISLLKHEYDLVLMDIPLEVFKTLPDLITQIDTIGLCINNSLYSVINTVRSLEESISKDSLLFAAKSRVIISKYNESNRYKGKKFTPEFTCEILNHLSGISKGEYKGAGIIPYSKDYDLQTGGGDRICNTNRAYRDYCLEILKNLI
ncbi:AAA family ATPase [Acetivibrio clariflavus]|uniref:AAA family ATPase n=1 Tax=Acetivibrio clariflavus TaxID=288965 RepID=UPI0004844344|nr:AAA family ATPase [Acetivibrio clariflavus]